MKFNKFRAKIFMLSVWEELDQLPDSFHGFDDDKGFKMEIDELIQEFGAKELEGLKILARFIK